MTIKRQCMRDQIRDLIVSRILTGAYPPGTRLKELALAHECNVSQAPVREALRDLEALGLVQSERYRGTRVRDSSRAELRDAYELRALIEERAAQCAVPMRETGLEDLARDITDLEAAIGRDDPEAHSEAMIHFHRTIVEASGNRAFLNAWDALQWGVRMRLAVQRAQRVRFDMGRLVPAHTEILEALRAGDGKRAGRLLREFVEFVIDALDEEGSVRPPTRGLGRERRGSVKPGIKQAS
jgi:DNA-binding GntR family transcriptional regulator